MIIVVVAAIIDPSALICAQRKPWSTLQDQANLEINPTHYQNQLAIIDRFLAGMIQPANLAGALLYMSLGPEEMGRDAHNYAWLDQYRKPHSKVA